jgi:hypothetical protein
MDIPEVITKSVIFIGYKLADGTYKLAGTGIILSRFPNHTPNVYVATARHVIDGIRDKGMDTVALRLNRKSGGPKWLDTSLNEWRLHPEGKNVDIAVLETPWDTQWDHVSFPIAEEYQATQDAIREYEIGVGNEVFIAGLFHPHHGTNNNIPVIRVGSIAAMPTEPVGTKLGPMNAYLIDTRSIRGLSGAPVFVVLGTTRTVSGLPNRQFQRFFLLGLVHGHFHLVEEELNLGIQIVVPVEKVAEMIAIFERAAEDQTKPAPPIMP